MSQEDKLRISEGDGSLVSPTNLFYTHTNTLSGLKDECSRHHKSTQTQSRKGWESDCLVAVVSPNQILRVEKGVGWGSSCTVSEQQPSLKGQPGEPTMPVVMVTVVVVVVVKEELLRECTVMFNVLLVHTSNCENMWNFPLKHNQCFSCEHCRIVADKWLQMFKKENCKCLDACLCTLKNWNVQLFI